ncbi:MAG: YidC/Oxa1 family membrane protein insertase [Chloroflexota bacterium]|nr:YidC/Oxa1 family membrane protein insertase [Chloroflexota bacterium]
MDVLVFIWSSFWHLLLNILVAINSVVHNPGVSIIIFTLFMRLLTVPLTMKSLRSSRNMQQIQPLIKEIQKKYPKDKAKQQEETMRIYQQYGVNPAASCLPMFIQLPIFIGLYSALRFTLDIHTGTPAQITEHLGELKGILFNTGWVNDANFAQPFLWVSSLAAADPLHIWPVLSGVFQFIQSRMSLPVRDPSQPIDSQTKMMQNMMQFMPLYIVFISLGFPTGTVVYWAFSSLFGAVQQYFITGFGTLPNLPGLGFLPRKQPPAPQPLPLPVASTDESDTTSTAIAKPKPSGVMGWMMSKALEAQEAQKASPEQNGGKATNGKASASRSAVRTATVIEGEIVKGRGSVMNSRKGTLAAEGNEVHEVSTSTMKHASDLKYRANGNGTGDGTAAEIDTLPRKRKSKR